MAKIKRRNYCIWLTALPELADTPSPYCQNAANSSADDLSVSCLRYDFATTYHSGRTLHLRNLASGSLCSLDYVLHPVKCRKHNPQCAPYTPQLPCPSTCLQNFDRCLQPLYSCSVYNIIQSTIFREILTQPRYDFVSDDAPIPVRILC